MATPPLFITCVSPERPHPSGRLAARLGDAGFDVRLLFEDARSIKSLWQDGKLLAQILANGSHSRAVVNVNGSIAQAIALGVCRSRGLQTTLWIMDSYPGCLRYVTRLWWLFYPFFFFASVVAKALADRVQVIDEAFVDHVPSWDAFRKKCVYVPLPQVPTPLRAVSESADRETSESDPVIGLLGNIESDWLSNDFPQFYREARHHGFRILVATSHRVDTRILQAEGIDLVIPWPKSETDRVFDRCTTVLVPLSTPRLVYSSPSKIIDCYMRGIQPIVMTPKTDWEQNRNRKIYGKCIHVSDFFAGTTPYAAGELKAYSELWTKRVQGEPQQEKAG